MSDLSSTAAHAPEKAQDGAYPVVLISLLFAAASVMLNLPVIKGGVFNALSTDDAMRLVEVRDLIGGQGWFDLFQHRMDPPVGTSMHWSRLIDAPLAAMILLLKPLVGIRAAETVTLYLEPALLFAIALALVVAIARRLSDSFIPVIAAAVLAVLCLPAIGHFQAGAIDHHNAQIALLLALVLMTAQIEQSAIKAAIGGLTASLSLAIGVEMLPAIAATGVAVVGLFIWRGAPVARQVAAFGAGLAGSSLLLAPALLPLSSLNNQVCDAFGGPVLLLTIGGGTTLMVMVAIDRSFQTLRMRIVSGAALAIILGGAFLALFPDCAAPPYAHLDPLLVSLWISNVAEAMPFTKILHLLPEKAFLVYGFTIMSLGFAIAALIRAPAPERFRWIAGIAPLAALIGVSIWQVRGAAGAAMVAAPLLAASLAVLWRGRTSATTLLLLSVALSPLGFAVAANAAKPLLDAIVKSGPMGDPSPCMTLSSIASLKQLPKGRIMAPSDLGPAILAETNHDVFAGPYHRNNDGIVALIRLMMAPPPAAKQILSDRHVDYVVTCPPAPDVNIIKLAPDGLEAQLSRGEVPDFLEPLHLDPADKIAVWRVRK